ncbi:ankyrin repeat domain-containing protein [Endozoicomonas sp. 4G]|uniref:ankyrin repeat domain-containing protein n=1 Tax=Endozoicomonas sp. 4G TaxID=2872754 RepID=UPI0020791273|nr:ankyrin repeat domain-containing protein [Endozoicomonas sp. 4G]
MKLFLRAQPVEPKNSQIRSGTAPESQITITASPGQVFTACSQQLKADAHSILLTAYDQTKKTPHKLLLTHEQTTLHLEKTYICPTEDIKQLPYNYQRVLYSQEPFLVIRQNDPKKKEQDKNKNSLIPPTGLPSTLSSQNLPTGGSGPDSDEDSFFKHPFRPPFVHQSGITMVLLPFLKLPPDWQHQIPGSQWYHWLVGEPDYDSGAIVNIQLNGESIARLPIHSWELQELAEDLTNSRQLLQKLAYRLNGREAFIQQLLDILATGDQNPMDEDTRERIEKQLADVLEQSGHSFSLELEWFSLQAAMTPDNSIITAHNGKGKEQEANSGKVPGSSDQNQQGATGGQPSQSEQEKKEAPDDQQNSNDPPPRSNETSSQQTEANPGSELTITFVGRTNAGKSSLASALLGAKFFPSDERRTETGEDDIVVTPDTDVPSDTLRIRSLPAYGSEDIQTWLENNPIAADEIVVIVFRNSLSDFDVDVLRSLTRQNNRPLNQIIFVRNRFDEVVEAQKNIRKQTETMSKDEEVSLVTELQKAWKAEVRRYMKRLFREDESFVCPELLFTDCRDIYQCDGMESLLEAIKNSVQQAYPGQAREAIWTRFSDIREETAEKNLTELDAHSVVVTLPKPNGYQIQYTLDPPPFLTASELGAVLAAFAAQTDRSQQRKSSLTVASGGSKTTYWYTINPETSLTGTDLFRTSILIQDDSKKASDPIQIWIDYEPATVQVDKHISIISLISLNRILEKIKSQAFAPKAWIYKGNAFPESSLLITRAPAVRLRELIVPQNSSTGEANRLLPLSSSEVLELAIKLGTGLKTLSEMRFSLSILDVDSIGIDPGSLQPHFVELSNLQDTPLRSEQAFTNWLSQQYHRLVGRADETVESVTVKSLGLLFTLLPGQSPHFSEVDRRYSVQENLLLLAQSMLDDKPENRPTLDQIIATLRTIQRDFKTHQLPKTLTKSQHGAPSSQSVSGSHDPEQSDVRTYSPEQDKELIKAISNGLSGQEKKTFKEQFLDNRPGEIKQFSDFISRRFLALIKEAKAGGVATKSVFDSLLRQLNNDFGLHPKQGCNHWLEEFNKIYKTDFNEKLKEIVNGDDSRLHTLQKQFIAFYTGHIPGTIWYEFFGDGQASLHRWARNGNSGWVWLWLQLHSEEAATLLNARDINERTPLHLAVYSGNEDTVRFILEHEPNVDAKDSVDYTPLHWAAFFGRGTIAEQLLQHNASLTGQHRLRITPLHVAAWNNQGAMVNKLLEWGASIDSSAYGIYPIHCAAATGSLNSLEALLAHRLNDLDVFSFTGSFNSLAYKPIALNALISSGHSALHIAAWYGHRKIVAKLIDAGADQKQLTKDGYMAGDLAKFRGHKYLGLSVSGKDVDQQKPNPPDPIDLAIPIANKLEFMHIDQYGYSTLHRAAREGDVNRVRDILINNEYTSARSTLSGYTPLHIAALYGHKEIAALLLSPANREDKTVSGNTPLHLAALFNRETMIAFLLDHSCRPDATTHSGITVLDVASAMGSRNTLERIFESLKQSKGDGSPIHNGVTAMHLAAKYGNIEAIRFLNQVAGISLEIETARGETPLHSATHSGQVETVKWLKITGVNLAPANKKGVTPLFMAAAINSPELIELLGQEGKPEHLTEIIGLTAERFGVASFSSIDEPLSLTPLHFAALKGNLEAVQALVMKCGAKLDTRSSGLTALDFASQGGHLKVVQWLIDE